MRIFLLARMTVVVGCSFSSTTHPTPTPAVQIHPHQPPLQLQLGHHGALGAARLLTDGQRAWALAGVLDFIQCFHLGLSPLQCTGLLGRSSCQGALPFYCLRSGELSKGLARLSPQDKHLWISLYINPASSFDVAFPCLLTCHPKFITKTQST